MATDAPQQHAAAAGGESAPDATPVDQTSTLTLGQILRRGREDRGLSLQQVAEQTKIARRHLESLEQDELASLPSGPYRRGQVIAFAQVVGVARDVALAHLERALNLERRDEESARETAVKREPAPERMLSVRTLAAAGALAVVATFAAWMWRSGTAQPPKGTAQQPGGSAQSPAQSGNTTQPDNAALPSSAAPPQSTSTSSATSSAAALPSPESTSVETPLAASVSTASLDAASLDESPLDDLPRGEPQLARATIGAAPPVADANPGRPTRPTPLDRPSPTTPPAAAASAAAAAAAAKVTRPARAAYKLVVITEPAGARVTVDEIGWGVTPLSLANVAPGTKRIRVTRDGYTSEQRTVTVPADGSATVRVRLRETRTTKR